MKDGNMDSIILEVGKLFKTQTKSLTSYFIWTQTQIQSNAYFRHTVYTYILVE